MENSEETLQILERYTRLKQKEIPKELEDYLEYVAKTGDTVFKWSNLKYLFREKLLHVIKNFNEDSPRLEEIPNYPNVDPFNYEAMKSSLLERLDLFNAAPFTVQRLCELLIEPRKQYTRIDKFMRALEKNILVVSTVEPGRKRAESENGDSLDSVVNGDLSLEVNIDIEMENEALFNNADERSGNAISPLKGLNPRPDDDLVEPKAKKVKLSLCKGIDDLDKSLSAEYAEAREAEARRIAKANLPETPDEPDEEEDELYEPIPHVKMCTERAKLSSERERERERMEKASESDKLAEVEKKNDVVKSLPKDGMNGDDDEKVIEKQEIEKLEKNKHEDDSKDDDEDEEVRTTPVESEQIASPSPEREVVDVLEQADEEEEEDITETKKTLNSKMNDDDDDQAELDADAVCEKEKADDEGDTCAKTETDTEIRGTAAAVTAAAAAADAAANAASADDDTNAIETDDETACKTKESRIEIKAKKEDKDKKETKQDEAKDETKRRSVMDDGNENGALAKDIKNPKTDEKQKQKAKPMQDAADEKLTEPPTKKKKTVDDKAASTATTSLKPETEAAKEENALDPVPIETDEPPTSTDENDEIAAAAVDEPPAQPPVERVVVDAEPVDNAASTNAAAAAATSSDVDTTSAVADQPMDEEQQVSPNAVEEVVMAELNKDEPAGMEVDDTSQEAMDQ